MKEAVLQQAVLLDGLNSQLLNKALERLVHIAIEAITDIGNLLIDTLIMRDPASYADIVDILEDERVISTDVAGALRPMVEFRRMLMQDYTSAHALEIRSYAENADFIERFIEQLRSYLGNSVTIQIT